MSETVRLRIPARPEYLVLGRLVLAGISRCRPLHPDDLADLKLAFTEACSNSMRHAYDVEPGVVEIAFELDTDSITIEVLDDGPGFERLAPAGEKVLGDGGLGLAIIEAVSDEIEIGRRATGTGSRLRFRKRLASPTTDGVA